MSLASVLQSKQSEISASDVAWRTFLKDFKGTILASSKELYLSDYERLVVYKYRLLDFLRAHTISIELMWIIVWLNNLGDALNFVEVEKLIIPDMTEINRIRRLFNASRIV